MSAQPTGAGASASASSDAVCLVYPAEKPTKRGIGVLVLVGVVRPPWTFTRQLGVDERGGLVHRRSYSVGRATQLGGPPDFFSGGECNLGPPGRRLHR